MCVQCSRKTFFPTNGKKDTAVNLSVFCLKFQGFAGFYTEMCKFSPVFVKTSLQSSREFGFLAGKKYTKGRFFVNTVCVVCLGAHERERERWMACDKERKERYLHHVCVSRVVCLGAHERERERERERESWKNITHGKKLSLLKYFTLYRMSGDDQRQPPHAPPSLTSIPALVEAILHDVVALRRIPDPAV